MKCPVCGKYFHSGPALINHCYDYHVGFYTLGMQNQHNQRFVRLCVCGERFSFDAQNYEIADHWLASPEEHLWLYRMRCGQ